MEGMNRILVRCLSDSPTACRTFTTAPGFRLTCVPIETPVLKGLVFNRYVASDISALLALARPSVGVY